VNSDVRFATKIAHSMVTFVYKNCLQNDKI